MKKNRLTSELVAVTKRYDLAVGYGIFHRFCYECLVELQLGGFEKQCDDVLIGLNKYLNGEVPGKTLDEMRVTMWALLEKIGKNKKEQIAKIKSYICSLYSRPASDDLLEILDYFCECYIGAGGSSEALIRLLEKNYP